MEVKLYHSYLYKKEYRSLLPTLGKEVMAKSLLTRENVTMYEESTYSLKREANEQTLDILSFTSLTSPFT